MGEDKDFDGELEPITHRGKLKEELEKSDPKLAELFEEQSDEQKAWGKLIGMLLLSKSNDDVENAFDWTATAINNGVELSNTQKAVAFFHAIASLGVDGAHYRILRRMYIKANTNE
jgi:hypothetical protein